ncbi:ImmA/IrrE family metallo-endopeptidase [Phormidesmis sp. 146-33]
MIRRKYIRQTVSQLLKAHGISEAPVDVVALASDMGIEVLPTEADDSLSGFLFRGEGGQQPVIGVNSAHHARRQRFTIAHELGHYVLHGAEKVHYDDKSRGFQVHLRSAVSAEGSDRLEVEANAFAAELLMPAAFLERDLENVSHIDVVDEDPIFNELVEKYGVSKRSMTLRLSHLGYVSDIP